MLQKKPIIALDFARYSDMQNFLKLFQGEQLNVKVGMEMYYAHGRPLLEELIEQGHDIFLDLKLHDIPNTVERAMRQLAQLGVAMVNVHASGGSNMMKAAKNGLIEGTVHNNQPPLLIAVTQLTSTTEEQVLNEQYSKLSLEDSVLNYAQLASDCQLDGVVCSPHEVQNIKAKIGSEFLTVTPGIRLADNQVSHDDQHRITTPAQAKELGTNYIVVGRPITQADNPYSAYQNIYQAWNK